MTILSPNDMCNSILQMVVTGSVVSRNIPTELKKDVVTLFPQKYTQNQVKSAKNEMIKGKNCFEALSAAKICFPFKPVLLMQMMGDPSFIEKEPQLCATIILFSYLTWCCDHYNSNESDYLSLIFEILKLLANHVKSDQNSQHIINVSISAMYNLLLMILPKKLDNVDISGKVEIIEGIISSVPNLPDAFFDIIVKVINAFDSEGNQNSPNAYSHFINFLVKLLKQLQDKFPKKIIEMSSPMISNMLSSLDKSSLEYVIAVYQKFGMAEVQAYLSLIPVGFVIQIDKNSVLGKLQNDEKQDNFVILSINTDQEINWKHKIAHPTDINSVVDLKTPTITFPEVPSLATQISPKLNDIANVFINELSKSPEFVLEIIPPLYKHFEEGGELSNSLDGYAFLLLIFKGFQKMTKLPIPIKLLTSQFIFYPGINAFNPPKNWNIINMLRHNAMEILIEKNIEHLYRFIDDTSRFPLLYAELLYRLTSFLSKIRIHKDFVRTYYNLLLKVNTIYQNMTGLSDNDVDSIRKARVAIFYILDKLFKNDKVLYQFFTDDNFMTAISPVVFEKGFQGFVINAFKAYSQKNIIVETSAFSEKIVSIFDDAFQYLDDVFYIQGCNYQICEFNRMIPKSENLAKMFERLINPLCLGILKLPSLNISRTLLSNTLKFLILESKYHHLRSQEVAALEDSMIRLLGKSPPQIFFNLLVKLTAGNENATPDSPFNIAQPKALHLLLLTFCNSPIFNNVLDFISHLCNYSDENKLQIHQHEVDIALLDIIQDERENSNCDLETITKTFEVFSLISKHASSVSVVQRFISLLCLVKGCYLPWYHKTTIDTFLSLISKRSEKLVESIPFNSSSGLTVNRVKGEYINDGFSFCCWIQSNVSLPDYALHLITLNDQKGQHLSIYLNWTSIMMSISNQGIIKTEYILSTHEWSLFTIVVINSNNENEQSTVFVYNNSQFIKEINLNTIRFDKGNLLCTLGGTSDGSISPDQPSECGQYALYPPLGAEQVANIYKVGATSTDLSCNPIFALVPYIPIDTIVIRNIVPSSSIYSKTELQALHPPSFTDVLCKRCGADIFLPIFAQWDIKFENETEMNDLPLKSLKLLKETLTQNIETQKSFYESHGFEIISFFLQTNNEKHINLESYKLFYKLFNSITCIELKEQLFTCVLTNVEILFRAPVNDHKGIIEHWTKYLFPKNIELSNLHRPFRWVVNIMRIYYYYKNDEPDIQRPQPYNADIKTCRKYLNMLAITLANYHFTNSDLYLLVCMIVNSKDPQQQLDYISILNNLITKGKNSPLLKATDSFKYIKLLQYLVNSPNKDVSFMSMKTLINAYRATYFPNMTVDAQFDIIIHQMSTDMITNEYFNLFLDGCIERIPEFFQITSWLAMNLGEDHIKQLYEKLQPSTSFINSPSWCIWSVISMYNYSEDIARIVASFLCRCSFSHFDHVYTIVDIVGHVYNEDSDSMKAIVLDEFVKALKDAPEGELTKNISVYYKCAQHFLFYRSEPAMEKRTKKIFQGSPFYEEETDFDEFTFMDKVSRSRSRPLLNSNGTERYSNFIAQKAYSTLAPKVEEEELVAEPRILASGNRRSKVHHGRRMSQFSIKIFTGEKVDLRQTQSKFTSNSDRLLPNDTLVIYRELQENVICYHFGIRETSEGKWADTDAAINFLKMFKKCPLKDFEATVVMIASFIIYSNRDIANFAISMINSNSNDLLPGLSFYDKNATRANEKRILKTPIHDMQFQSNEFLINYQSDEIVKFCQKWKSTMNMIKDYEDKNSIFAYQTYELTTASNIIAVTNNMLADFKDEINQFKTASTKLWQQLWHSFSIERGPWHKSLPPNMLQSVHYRREFTFCWSLFPPKLKQNFNFDIHFEASLVRDTGSTTDAMTKLQEYKEQLQSIYNDSVLSNLFEITDESVKSKTDNTLSTSKCIIELPCEIIKINKTYEEANFSLMENCIVLAIGDKKSTAINLKSIVHVFPRTRLHHPTAIEIFTEEGQTYFINFPNFSSAQVLKSFKNLITVQPLDFKLSLQQSRITERWIKREISNFQYLMFLNIYSGRSVNDISQYPVFPWVLDDYTSKKLDLNDPKVYRDLSKPIGALDETRLNELKDKAEQLDAIGLGNYLYSSAFSCPLTVCLYMIRLEPYTTMHIDIQGGQFDVPARVFSSIADAYRLVKTTHNDFRELTPEFFLMPEFLVNSDRFDLGRTSNGKIDDVVLPPWANDSPIEFIYKNRKALESEYVSQNINNWIDLIWGEKQRGGKAKAANNVFMHEMYSNIWDEIALNDIEKRSNVEAVLCHIGQIPPQLFDKPHPKPEPLQPKKKHIHTSKMVSFASSLKLIMLDLVTKDHTVKIYAVDDNYVPKNFTYEPTVLLDKPDIIPSQVPMPNSHNQSMTHSSSSGIALSAASRGSQVNLLKPVRKRLIGNPSKAANLPSLGDFIPLSQPTPPTPGGRMVRNNSFSGLTTIVAQKDMTKTIMAFNKNGAFDVVNENLHELFRVDFEMKLIVKHRSEITTIASDHNWTAVADKDSIVSLYQKKKLKFTIPLFSSTVKCIAINSMFKSAVCGTKDGFLLFCSLNSGIITKTVNLCGMRPISILITPSWGFVTVYMTELSKGQLHHYIKIYTINGDFIRSRRIGKQVGAWSSFNNNSGFDYIIMANSENKVYLFEAFYLELGTEIYRSDFNINAVSYILNDSIAVLASTKGKAVFVSAELPQ
ncbi:Beige/BEACH domain containing protein [Tritrichomonas foetus]|uniref:Beige/BEACH domain containing protein n=1 Tax=Tritrichomonas foetus TaxID=1144522 RepID=A0A1J4JYG1_9EUKA|nr:Beige/BEACH domain containing protein [Tritrichomonas foetus]|eukprot:OHT04027.1 Beige/BEACH domain containing protein [Tritrichomonas foetus]